MKNAINLAALLVVGLSLTGCEEWDRPFESERSVHVNVPKCPSEDA